MCVACQIYANILTIAQTIMLPLHLRLKTPIERWLRFRKNSCFDKNVRAKELSELVLLWMNTYDEYSNSLILKDAISRFAFKMELSVGFSRKESVCSTEYKIYAGRFQNFENVPRRPSTKATPDVFKISKTSGVSFVLGLRGTFSKFRKRPAYLLY